MRPETVFLGLTVSEPTASVPSARVLGPKATSVGVSRLDSLLRRTSTPRLRATAMQEQASPTSMPATDIFLVRGRRRGGKEKKKKKCRSSERSIGFGLFRAGKDF